VRSIRFLNPIVFGALAMVLVPATSFAQQQGVPQNGASPEIQKEPEPTIARDGAILQGLDKVTARISTFEAPTATPVQFGTLQVVVRTCNKKPPEEPPESAAFLEIDDVRPGDAPRRIFTGWMFASSPSLSALEHPVYDVWVVDCMNASSSSSLRSE